MPVSRSPRKSLLAADEVREELAAILSAHPSLPSLLHPQQDEPDLPQFELLCSGLSPFYVVRVPIRERAGTIWASRLPGIRPGYTREEVDALARFGIDRVVCLVPTLTMEQLHGADRYLSTVKESFGDRFHQVEIVDHEVPGDDAAFERAVALADGAVASGEQVLVHCVGGCGRTGMFVACLMVRTGLDPVEAIREFRRRRRCGPETPEQLAYVLRYASRLRLEERATRRRYRREELTVRVTRGADGAEVKIAQGGIASVYTGRIRFPRGRTRRVAVKRFAYPVNDETASRMQRCIETLVAEGVRLPPTFLHRLDDAWVQVSPLFGSFQRGSKLHQPGQFFRQASPEERRFAVDQLARVANAGYRPSLDLFVLFRDGTGRMLPIDLDLVVPMALTERAAELLKALIRLGTCAGERDELLELARKTANDELLTELDRLMGAPNSPYRALWNLD